jgi:diguanylate cyclase
VNASATIEALLAQAKGQRLAKEAVALAGQALTLARSLGDERWLAQALLLLGRYQYHDIQLELALDHLREAERLFMILADPLGQAHCLNAIAVVYFRSGLQHEALAVAEDALTVFERHASHESASETASAYNVVGMIARAIAAPGASLAALAQALELSEAAGDWGVYGNACANYGNLYLDLADEYQAKQPEAGKKFLAKAELWFKRGLKAGRSANDLALYALCCCKLGRVLSKRKKYKSALMLHEKSLALLKSSGYNYVITLLLFMQSETLIEMNALEEAIIRLKVMLEQLENSQNHNNLGLTLKLLSKTCEARGDFQQALQFFVRFHEVETKRYRQQQQLILNASHMRQETERIRQENIVLSQQVQQDALTGLANRRALNQALEQNRYFCIVLADVDYFKRINDRFSHGIGDQVLQWLSHLFVQHTQQNEMAARYGGEEFALLWHTPDHPVAALARCQRLRQMVESFAWERLHPDISVTMSFGLALMDEASDPNGALALADARLYQAKHRGRNCVIGIDEFDAVEQ